MTTFNLTSDTPRRCTEFLLRRIIKLLPCIKSFSFIGLYQVFIQANNLLHFSINSFFDVFCVVWINVFKKIIIGERKFPVCVISCGHLILSHYGNKLLCITRLLIFLAFFSGGTHSTVLTDLLMR